jgi:hypothetical protein
MEEIHSACQDAVNGLPSQRPVIEMTIPSVLDKTISPPGTSDHFALKMNHTSFQKIIIIIIIIIIIYALYMSLLLASILKS